MIGVIAGLPRVGCRYRISLDHMQPLENEARSPRRRGAAVIGSVLALGVLIGLPPDVLGAQTLVSAAFQLRAGVESGLDRAPSQPEFPESIPTPEPAAWPEEPLRVLAGHGFHRAALPTDDMTDRLMMAIVSAETPWILDRDWLLGLGALTAADDELECLREAIYHEARGEDVIGQYAVAEVILNRVDSRRYPDTICAVVNQNAHRRNACQFSYACDDRPRTLRDRNAIRVAGQIARISRQQTERWLTGGATHYHAVHVAPDWAAVLQRTARIGAHVFYRDTWLH